MRSASCLGLGASLAALFLSIPAFAGENAPQPDTLARLGDAAFKAGRLPEAAALYERARTADPLNADAARGICRIALAAGDFGTAREVCQRAFLLGDTAEDYRNKLASLVDGPTPPSMDDLAMSFLLAQATFHKSRTEPWAYDGLAVIATRVGDRELLDGALRDLQRVAPGHEVTMRALSRARPHASPWIWLGRIALVLFLLMTAAHAVGRSKWLGKRRRGSTAAAVVAFALAAVAGHRADAQQPVDQQPLPSELSTIPIDDAKPETSVPTPEAQMKNPLAFGYFLQDVLGRADMAAKRGDHATAARYYGALAKAVPSRAYAFVKQCDELLALGDRRGALDACHEALFKEAVTLGDYKRYVQLMIGKVGPLSEEDRRDLDAVFAHLDEDKASAVAAQVGRCQVALRVHDTPALAACTEALTKAAPDGAETISMQWALAIERGEAVKAFKLIGRAEAAGVAASGLDQMKSTTRGLAGQLLGRALLWIGASVVGIFLIRFLARKVTGLRRAPVAGA